MRRAGAIIAVVAVLVALLARGACVDRGAPPRRDAEIREVKAEASRAPRLEAVGPAGGSAPVQPPAAVRLGPVLIVRAPSATVLAAVRACRIDDAGWANEDVGCVPGDGAVEWRTALDPDDAIVLAAEGCVPVEYTVPPRSAWGSASELELRPGLRVRGRLSGAGVNTGDVRTSEGAVVAIPASVPPVGVWAGRAALAESRNLRGRVASSGEFEIPGVAPDRDYTLCAALDDIVGSVRLRVGPSDVDGVEITGRRAFHLTIRYEDQSGAPVRLPVGASVDPGTSIAHPGFDSEFSLLKRRYELPLVTPAIRPPSLPTDYCGQPFQLHFEGDAAADRLGPFIVRARVPGYVAAEVNAWAYPISSATENVIRLEPIGDTRRGGLRVRFTEGRGRSPGPSTRVDRPFRVQLRRNSDPGDECGLYECAVGAPDRLEDVVVRDLPVAADWTLKLISTLPLAESIASPRAFRIEPDVETVVTVPLAESPRTTLAPADAGGVRNGALRLHLRWKLTSGGESSQMIVFTRPPYEVAGLKPREYEVATVDGETIGAYRRLVVSAPPDPAPEGVR